MKRLTAKLLGIPQIILDGRSVTIPFKQAEALLYYLLVEKRARRDFLAGLIWEECTCDRKASSNMRNALYVLRKTLSPDFIITAPKNVISVNPDWDIELDVSALEGERSAPLQEYGDFLRGFYLRDNISYNEWIAELRERYKKRYVQLLKFNIWAAAERGDLSAGETLASKLVALDEFDESGYCCLMRIYRAEGKYREALAAFDRLKSVMAAELHAVPGAEASELAQSIRTEYINTVVRAEALEKNGDVLHGRDAEMSVLEESVSRFINGDEARSSILVGEAGIGKTKLLRGILSFYKGGEPPIFEAACYRAEESIALKPWLHVFEQILYFIAKREATQNDVYFRTVIGIFFPYLVDLNSCGSGAFAAIVRRDDGNSVTHALLRFAQNAKIIISMDKTIHRNMCTYPVMLQTYM